MASAHNLIGLVNQLQNIESTMMAAIMEMLMKVATLTDANVFLLVDAVEGRRFAGKRHLVDAYLGGTLGPVGTDVEMELDPSVTALRRRPVNGVTPGSRPGAPLRPTMPFRSNGNDRTPPMKRPMAPSFATKDPDSAAKRVRPTPFPSSSSKPTPPPPNGVESAEPVVEAVGSVAEEASTPAENEESSAGTAAKESTNEKDVKMAADVKPFLDITGFNDDEGRSNYDERRADYDSSMLDGTGSGESDVEELAEISSFDEFTAGGEGEGQGRRIGGGELTLFNPTMAKAHSSIDPSEFYADFDILAFMQANPKATALRAEFDMSVLDKSSVTHKLLTSLLYDISKASAANAPIKDKKSDVSKAFFNYVFENVWESFPNFEGLMSMGAKVRDGGKDKNIKYFMRHKMQKWYGAMLDKMLGAEQPPQPQQPPQPAGNLQYLQWQ